MNNEHSGETAYTNEHSCVAPASNRTIIVVVIFQTICGILLSCDQTMRFILNNGYYSKSILFS